MAVDRVVVMIMVVVMFLSTFGKGDACGTVDDIPALQEVVHEFLQTCAGDHHQLGGFHSANLIDVQGIVVETGYRLRYQSSDGNVRAFAQPQGKFIHRTGGGGDGSAFLPDSAAGKQKQNNPQEGKKTFHKHDPNEKCRYLMSVGKPTTIISHMSRKKRLRIFPQALDYVGN